MMARTPVIQRTLKYLDNMTEYWLGWSLPPAQHEISKTNWKRDIPAAYCPRCGATVGKGEVTETGCGSCRDLPPIGDTVIRLGAYTDPLRQWIITMKYNHRWTEMAETLGRELGRAVNDRHIIQSDQALVVPMPMPWQRRLFRGIDHARLLAEGVAKGLRAPLISPLTKANGQPQITMSYSQRMRSGSHGLRLRSSWKNRKPTANKKKQSKEKCVGGGGGDYVLVDDVRTSGASLRAAVRLLRQLKPRQIIIAIVAVSDDPSRRVET